MKKLHGGDKVRIKRDLKAGDVYHCIDGSSDHVVTVTGDMIRFCGKECTIDEVVLGGRVYQLDEDLHCNLWVEDMFEPAPDQYNSVPDHYTIEGFKQPSIDVIRAVVKHNHAAGWSAFCLGNALKYLFRFGRKGGVKDLYKALDYLRWLIKEYEYDKGRA